MCAKFSPQKGLAVNSSGRTSLAEFVVIQYMVRSTYPMYHTRCTVSITASQLRHIAMVLLCNQTFLA